MIFSAVDVRLKPETTQTSGQWGTRGMRLTYVFSIHVVEEAEAVGRRVGDTVRVFRSYVEKRAHKPSLVAFLSWSRSLDVHVETLKHRDTKSKHKAYV